MTHIDKLRQSLIPQFTFSKEVKKLQSDVSIYIDGSYDTKRKISGFGFVVVKDNKVIYKDNGFVDDQVYGSRNITGEIMSSIMALRWAEENNYNFVNVFCDYVGLGFWAAKEWKTKKPIAKKYLELLSSFKIKADFYHVKGHSGDTYNEMVDQEAEAGKFGKYYEI